MSKCWIWVPYGFDCEENYFMGSDILQPGRNSLPTGSTALLAAFCLLPSGFLLRPPGDQRSTFIRKLVDLYWNTHLYNPEDLTIDNRRCENLKFKILSLRPYSDWLQARRPKSWSSSPVGTRFFLSPYRPDWPCSPPSLISNGYWGSFPGIKAARAWSWPFISN
jgi:hypothetical protein